MSVSKYDYIIVGAGLFGCTVARLLKDKGAEPLIIEQRNHLGGNCYSQRMYGVDVHLYGPHIFHTDNNEVIGFIDRFTRWRDLNLSVKTKTKDGIFTAPINLTTFDELGIASTEKHAREFIDQETAQYRKDSYDNLEEYALGTVGPFLYNLFFKKILTDHWGNEPKNLPTYIMQRLPVRFTANSQYYHDNTRFIGVPLDGYDKLFEKMVENIDVILGKKFLYRQAPEDIPIIYTGEIDMFFGRDVGSLEYRTLDVSHKISFKPPDPPSQAHVIFDAVGTGYREVNYTYFNSVFGWNTPTIISSETAGPRVLSEQIPYYPVPTQRNLDLYATYKKRLDALPNVYIGGRLGLYQYLDMDKTILKAMKLVEIL